MAEDQRTESLKRYENLKKDHKEDDSHTSLQDHAKERAKHPNDLKIGSPYEWEELEAYKKELERLEREGPKLKNP